MRRITRLGSTLAVFTLVAGISTAQESATTPAPQTTLQGTDSPAVASTPAAGVQDSATMNPTATSSTEVERTVVSDRPDYGKWGLLGLLGLLGLTGLRRREGGVTVVDRTTPRPPSVEPPPTTRR